MSGKQLTAALVALGLGWLAWAAPDASAGAVQWERYVSQKCIFTLKKPAGWAVAEGDQENPRFWYCSVMDPTGAYQASMIHGVSPTGQDVPALAARLFGNLKKQFPTLELRPKAWSQDLGNNKRLIVSEGTYTDAQGRRKEFKNFLFAGDGSMLNQRLETPDGELSRPPAQASEWVGVLLETLGSIQLAQNVFDAPPAQQAPQPAQLALHRLPSGWGQFQAPADWQVADLGKGQFVAFDPSKQLCVIVANAHFISPQYYRAGMPGVVCSPFVPPSQAFVKACTAQGAAANFRTLAVNPRQDVVALLRASTGGRPAASEDFTYTFTREGKACKGFTFGMCTGDIMNAGFTLSHFTIWATADQFDAARPTLTRILCSYQLNEAAVQEYVAAGLRRYHEGIAELSRTIARNSDEMRRENFELFMRRGESQRYIDYMRSRTIMGEWDYVVRGAGGYEVLRADHTGLYDQDGNYLTHRSYGEPYTNHMTPIDSHAMFDRYRPW